MNYFIYLIIISLIMMILNQLYYLFNCYLMNYLIVNEINKLIMMILNELFY